MKRDIQLDQFALQLQKDKHDFDGLYEAITEELKIMGDIKITLQENLRHTNKLIKKMKKNFSHQVSKSSAILTRLHKSDASAKKNKNSWIHEKTLRTQAEKQVEILEENLESLEGQFARSQIENEDLSEQLCDISSRLNFVQEADVHEMAEKCEKYEKLQGILNKDFQLGLKSVTESIGAATSVVCPIPADEEGMCVACKSEKSQCVIVPCGHQCVCLDCSRSIGGRCPYCQTNIDSILKVYTV